MRKRSNKITPGGGSGRKAHALLAAHKATRAQSGAQKLASSAIVDGAAMIQVGAGIDPTGANNHPLLGN